MLDTETKRRIDTARDILVGKVPDPKSQVEQITIALIYKFMDDMDLESEELGGKRSFFQGDFEKYAWRKIFDPRMGGYEILTLYSEAIMKMNVNPNIPQLFRDIFKNAYLPYRDPETLKAFLKVINDFTYDHSERLGDAFEYLLAVLGSQGEAGQFRTPRHIIDFMVEIIDPKKDEIIIDPACGTAGFLISSYKHIIKRNSSSYKPEDDTRIFESKDISLAELTINSKKYNGDKLTPDERSRLANSIKGYDISPDMVRLSLVNMYLHGLHDPHIHEYDTLTSEDKWNEYADVILANPPFMSPKGGIRPHKRFSISSSRSEVLFVDYIAEHLTPNGRAAVIVPEGIIFQTGTAYKSLRKILVENYLVGVISLPAGVFQPYSGVKTSILWLDKTLAKKTDKILFVKIENDGFDLGAQRRSIKQNDLPDALNSIFHYRFNLTNYQSESDSNLKVITVDKQDIIRVGDYNLSGDRYHFEEQYSSSFPKAKLGDICVINPKKTEVKDLSDATIVSFVPMADLNENQVFFKPKQIKKLGDVYKGYTYFKNNDVLLARVTPCFENGKAGLALSLENGIGFGSSEYTVLRANEKVIPYWIYLAVTSDSFKKLGKDRMTGTGGLQRVPNDFISSFSIPLPPLSIQEEIVAEIEGYQKIIDGARQVVENYKPHIDIDPEWPMVNFADYVFFQEGPGIRNWQFTNEGVKLLNVKNIVKDEIVLENSNKYISLVEFNNKYKHFLVEDGDIILASSGATYGKNAYFRDSGYPVIVNTSNIRLHPKDTKFILQGYIKAILDSNLFREQIDRLITGSAQPNFGPSHLKQVKIPLPSIQIQEEIIRKNEIENKLIQGNQELILLYEKKIKDRIAKVWEE